MRNLKKFLALVLAMMMVFGLMVTANAADVSYTDLNEVGDVYDESVKVTTALGVFQGQGDSGKFAPKSYIQRDEFATVLYRLATGDVDAEHISDYNGKAYFNDVPAGHWAAPYVAYAYENKLMIGYNGNFYPTTNIDGHDAALTLMRLLGRGAMGEYSGTDYKLNVAIDAARFGISGIVGTRNLTGNATREVVAGLAYGALNSEKVYYSADNGKYLNERDDYAATLGEIVFDMWVARSSADLAKLGVDSNDDFGRPITYAVVVDDEVIYEGTPVATKYVKGDFTGKIVKSLEKTYGAATPADATAGNLTYWYNGADSTSDMPTVEKSNGSTDTFSWAAQLAWHNDNAGLKGLEVEVYEIEGVGRDDPDTCVVVFREAYLAYVDEVEDEEDNIVVSVYSGYTDGVTDLEFEFDEDDHDFYDMLLTHQGEYIAVYPSFDEGDIDGLFEEIGVLEIIEGADVTRSDVTKSNIKSTSTLVADGTTYNYNRMAVRGEDDEIDGTAVYSAVTLAESTLYLYNGYILMIDQTEAVSTTGYAYLYDVRVDAGWTSEKDTVGVRMYLEDGTSVEVEAKNADDQHVLDSPENFNWKTNGGQLVYYKVNSKGVYELQGLTKKDSTSGSIDLKVETGVAKGNILSGGNATFDSKTVFFVVDTSGDAPVVKTYTGITKAPKLTHDSDTKLAAAQYNSVSKVVSDAVNNSTVSALLVEDPENGSTDGNYFIVINPSAKVITEKVGTIQLEYYEYNAIVDGKETKVKVDKDYADAYRTAMNEATAGELVAFFKSVTVDDYGVITKFSSAVAGAHATDISKVTNGSVVTIDGSNNYLVTSNLKVYLYDLNSGKFTVKSIRASAIAGDEGNGGWYVVDDGTLVELYVRAKTAT